MSLDELCNVLVDSSKPEWNNGVTNLKMIDAVGSRWTRTHGGWYFLAYDNVDVEAIALNDEGYLLADTTTPDGYYVNKHGVLEIGGREVAHCEGCMYVATSIDVPDKNHVDPNQYRYQDIGIGYSWGMTSYSFGNLVYNHFHGYDREKGLSLIHIWFMQVIRSIKRRIRTFYDCTLVVIIYTARCLGKYHERGISVPVSCGNCHKIIFLINDIRMTVRVNDVFFREQAVNSAFQRSVPVFVCVGIILIRMFHFQVQIPLVDVD